MIKIKLVSNIIINENEEILLIKKTTSNRTYPISGKLEENEKWLDGAKREIREETALTPMNTHFITKSTQVFENDKEIETQWFFTSWVSGKIEKDYREGEIFWADIDDIDELDLLTGDKKIITDFLTGELKDCYLFNYDQNRELIND